MYPIQCKAGFPVPIKAGKFDILKIVVPINDMTADSRLVLVDDSTITENDKQGKVLGNLSNVKTILCDLKADGATSGAEGVLKADFSTNPIKTRYGLSLYYDNIIAGSVCVYWR